MEVFLLSIGFFLGTFFVGLMLGDWKEVLIAGGITLPVFYLIWYCLSLYKKVIIRWIVQMLIFFFLSVVLTGFGIIIFLVKANPMNVFWFSVTFRIGFYFLIAFLVSIYFLVTRGIIFPKRKKRDYERLKKQGFDEWIIETVLRNKYGG